MSDKNREPPLLSNKNFDASSVFTPENLLREARRQKKLAAVAVPEICLLDPDGDILRYLQRLERARRHPEWPCYHTDLYMFESGAHRCGIIGCAVGAAFAVLIAEELFASGCQLLLSITSAGQIASMGDPPYFVVIDRALRDEGTSYHYLPPGDFSEADTRLVRPAYDLLAAAGMRVHIGPTWTTDAPFRETQSAIDAAAAHGILAVEMEAAALYAFGQARGRAVICFAHVTNQMARIEGDFEKGASDGAEESLRIVSRVAEWWRRTQPDLRSGRSRPGILRSEPPH